MTQPDDAPNHAERLDVTVVGAGFAGLYALHRARQAGLKAHVLEAGSGIGGTWFWNCYPGARCDVESIAYSYSFSPELEQDWKWTERYASQPELLRYIEHVADRFDLRRDISLNSRVVAADFDEVRSSWTVRTESGQRLTSQFLIMATGCLSEPVTPSLPGLDTFAGERYMTARWPREGVDLSGKRVGVVGTGSTGIQVIQELAPVAGQLTVFQRTPNFSVPGRNAPLPAEELAAVKACYRDYRRNQLRTPSGVPMNKPFPTLSVLDVSQEELYATLELAWEEGGATNIMRTYTDIFVDPEANARVADFIRDKIRGVVGDPEVAAGLCPSDHPLGSKRVCVDSGYFDVYNRENVSLVNLKDSPVVAVTPSGVQTTEMHHDLDVLVFATGFDAMTGALFNIDILGRDRLPLRDAWADGPRAYLGLQTHGFPNMFLIAGPFSPSVLSNMVVLIEQNVDWVFRCIKYMRGAEIATIEADADAESGWLEHTAAVGGKTVFATGASWYTGANVEGKPRVFTIYIGGLDTYLDRCEAIVQDGYEGFCLERKAAPAT